MRKINPYLYLEGMKLFNDGKQPPCDAPKCMVKGYTQEKKHQEGNGKCQPQK